MREKTPSETSRRPAARAPQKLGYAPVNLLDPDPQLQIDALLQAGAARIFTDAIGDPAAQRPGFAAMMHHLREGDTIYVWKLGRLGRNVRQVLTTFHDLVQRGIGVVVITQPAIDTTAPGGRLILTVMGAVVEMEHDLIRERTHAGLATSRAMGRVGGRRQIASDDQIKAVRLLGTEAGAAKVGLSAKQFKRRLDQIRLGEMKEV